MGNFFIYISQFVPEVSHQVYWWNLAARLISNNDETARIVEVELTSGLVDRPIIYTAYQGFREDGANHSWLRVRVHPGQVTNLS